MREFFQSCGTFAFTISLLGIELIDKITSKERGELGGTATEALDSVSNAAADQLGPRLRSTFRSLNEVQRAVVGTMSDLSLELARNTLNGLTDEGGRDRYQNVLLDR
jgi:hypothetical protein